MNEVGYWNETYNCVRKSWVNTLDEDTVARFKAIPYDGRLKAYKHIDKLIFTRFTEELARRRSDGTLNDISKSTTKFAISEDSKPNRVLQVIGEASSLVMNDLNIDQLLAPYETVRGNTA